MLVVLTMFVPILHSPEELLICKNSFKLMANKITKMILVHDQQLILSQGGTLRF